MKSIFAITNTSLETKHTIRNLRNSAVESNEYFAHNANECQDSEVERESLHEHAEDNGVDGVETDGALYIKVRDPPDLKRLFPCLHPVNLHMREKEARLETFDRRWPSQKINATPEHIVKAGLFYLGDGDRAKCLYCNGGLQHWEPNDEPFTEHAKRFPGCEYILQCKGVDFVKRIVSKFPNLRRPTLRNPRFDHKTMKLISIEPQPDQRLPEIIDPRANNNSAGNVLRSYSPTNSNSQKSAAKDDSRSKELEESAISMGFELPLIKKVMERHIRNNGRHFPNLVELIDALVDEPPEQNEIACPANHELHENQVFGHGIAPSEVYAPLSPVAPAGGQLPP